MIEKGLKWDKNADNNFLALATMSGFGLATVPIRKQIYCKHLKLFQDKNSLIDAKVFFT